MEQSRLVWLCIYGIVCLRKQEATSKDSTGLVSEETRFMSPWQNQKKVSVDEGFDQKDESRADKGLK